MYWGFLLWGNLYLGNGQMYSLDLNGTLRRQFLRHYWKKGDLWVGPSWLGPQVGGSLRRPGCRQMPPLFLSPHCLLHAGSNRPSCCSPGVIPTLSSKKGVLQRWRVLGPHLSLKSLSWFTGCPASFCCGASLTGSLPCVRVFGQSGSPMSLSLLLLSLPCPETPHPLLRL